MNNQMLNFAQQLVKTNQSNIPDVPWRDAAIRQSMKCRLNSKWLLFT